MYFQLDATDSTGSVKSLKSEKSMKSMASANSNSLGGKSISGTAVEKIHDESDCLIARISLCNEIRPMDLNNKIYQCVQVFRDFWVKKIYKNKISSNFQIGNSDKTGTVIEKTLEKHQVSDCDPADFVLVQILPDGEELVLPEKANAFYAIDGRAGKTVELQLRRRVDLTPNATIQTVKKKKRFRTNLLRWSSGYL